MEQQIKFNKSFEALYNSAMTMADQVIVNKEMPKRFEKLDEEYEELKLEVDKLIKLTNKLERPFEDLIPEKLEHLKGELSDVLFVLLHIGHKLNFTAFELLHQAMSKMLARMNDATYIAKN